MIPDYAVIPRTTPQHSIQRNLRRAIVRCLSTFRDAFPEKAFKKHQCRITDFPFDQVFPSTLPLRFSHLTVERSMIHLFRINFCSHWLEWSFECFLPLDIVRSWDPGIVRSWDREILGSCDRGIVGSWDRQIVGSWDRGIVRSWDRGIVRSWDREASEFSPGEMWTLTWSRIWKPSSAWAWRIFRANRSPGSSIRWAGRRKSTSSTGMTWR